MPNPLSIGKALHEKLERELKGAPVRTKKGLHPLTKKLMTETAMRERGEFGKKKSRALTDADDGYMDDAVDIVEVREGGINAMVNEQLNQPGSSLTGYSIMEEIEQDRLSGKLRPFVEGEPIGKRQKWVRKPAPMLKTEKELYEERQKCLNELREKNDRAIARILNRR